MIFSGMKVTRYNGQPTGEMDIRDADGKPLGYITAEYDDPTWFDRANRTHKWVVVQYEVVLFDREDARIFSVRDYANARAALAAAKDWARQPK